MYGYEPEHNNQNKPQGYDDLWHYPKEYVNHRPSFDRQEHAETAPRNAAPASSRSSSGKKRGRKAGYAAALLTVSLLSGTVGGGVGYYLQGGPATGNTPEQTPLTVTSTVGSTGATSDIAAIAAKASVSVVEVSVETTYVNPFFGEATQTGSGSGVVVSEDGYIVTNNHVAGEAGQITVRTVGGDEYEAALVGTDSKTDLALLKVDAQGLTPVTFADSDQVQVGELSVAIGNSLGTLGGTVTDGIISAKNREITIDNEEMILLQTSAAVNPGNSGGGLFNAAGDLIGLVNAKSSGSDVEGLGFAIPSNTVQQVVAEILQNGYVSGRPELGVSVLEIADQQAALYYRVSEPGLYVVEVNRDNGLQSGDRIVRVDGEEISSSADLKAVLENYAVDDTLDVVVARGGETITVTVSLGEQVPAYIRERVNQSSSI